MRIADIRSKYLKLNKAIREFCPGDSLTEYDSLMQSLKKFDDLEVKEFIKLLKNVSVTTTPSEVKQKPQTLEEALAAYGVGMLDYKTVTIETIDEIQSRNLLPKSHLIELANKIGISKTVFKTKGEVYEELRRFVTNRDILGNIEAIIKSADK